MIPFGSQRGGGGDLAIHLSNAEENELVELYDLRGAIAADLHGAFSEWEAQAHAMTKAEKYLYSLSINPDQSQGRLNRKQYEDYITRAEHSLGLAGQPRAIVFHIKEHGEGVLREHCHVVWSRIDAGECKAIHIPFDQRKLMAVTRQFAHDHQLTLPEGYTSGRAKNHQLSLYDKAHQDRTGITRQLRQDLITQLWKQSDGPESFVAGLEDSGYLLATGRRPYLLVDTHGHVSALPRMIDDKTVRARDVQKFLETRYPVESLISVEEAQERQKTYLAEITGLEKTELMIAEREKLKARQDVRRAEMDKKIEFRKDAHEREKRYMALTHDEAIATIAAGHKRQDITTAFNRASNDPKGLSAILARLSGVSFVRQKAQEREDRKLEIKRDNARQLLEVKYEAERAAQTQRQQLELMELRREQRVQELTFTREAQSLENQEEQCRANRQQIIMQAKKAKNRAPNEPELHLGPQARPANLARAARRTHLATGRSNPKGKTDANAPDSASLSDEFRQSVQGRDLPKPPARAGLSGEAAGEGGEYEDQFPKLDGDDHEPEI